MRFTPSKNRGLVRSSAISSVTAAGSTGKASMSLPSRCVRRGSIARGR